MGVRCVSGALSEKRKGVGTPEGLDTPGKENAVGLDA